MKAEGIEHVVDRVDGDGKNQTLRESLSECALKLKQDAKLRQDANKSESG
jgi:hypothetical protein